MIGRELRRRIKKTFDAQRIEIPFPHVSLYMGEVSNPFLSRTVSATEEAELVAMREQAAAARRTEDRQRTSAGRDASDTEGLGDVG